MKTTDNHLELEQRFGATNYAPLPVVLSRGLGALVWDTEGREYLDCLAAYSAVNQGHCHPRIVEALTQQASRLALTSRAFHNDLLGRFAERLCTTFGYQRMLPMNSGAEGVETALKLARRWGYARKGIANEKAKVLVFDGNFHGRTLSIISFSSDPDSHDWFGPYTPGFVSVPYNDAEAMRRAMKDHNICAMLIEPIQGEAGVKIPDEGFLRACRIECDKNEALMIADEIQTGLGRTGYMLACEHERVRPDVVILGKALSGGMYPVSAVLADDDVMLTIAPGQHGSTYGGNPLACAVGMAALDVLEGEDLCQRSKTLGPQFLDLLRGINSPLLTKVRGRGLMCAIEISTFTHAGKKCSAKDVCYALMERGVLAKPTHGHIIRLTPPLVVTAAQLERAAAAVGDALKSFQGAEPMVVS